MVYLHPIRQEHDHSVPDVPFLYANLLGSRARLRGNELFQVTHCVILATETL